MHTEYIPFLTDLIKYLENNADWQNIENVSFQSELLYYSVRATTNPEKYFVVIHFLDAAKRAGEFAMLDLENNFIRSDYFDKYDWIKYVRAYKLKNLHAEDACKGAPHVKPTLPD